MPIPVKTVADRKSTRLNSSHTSISYAVFFFLMQRHPPSSSLFPYTTLFRSLRRLRLRHLRQLQKAEINAHPGEDGGRSEEHTSELQSHFHLVRRFFFFNAAAPTEFFSLSLHDALPISSPSSPSPPSPASEGRNKCPSR